MKAPRISATAPVVRQLATFHIGDLLLAIPIDRVREINRNLDLTWIPHAPTHVRGVVNLRGEVVSVIDLRRVMGLSPAERTSASRNLIVRDSGESVGLWVDRMSDILAVRSDTIWPTPDNIASCDGRLLAGVHRTSDGLVLLLDVDAVLQQD